MDKFNKSEKKTESKFWSMLAGILVLITLGMGGVTLARAWTLFNFPQMSDILNNVETNQTVQNLTGSSNVNASSVLPQEGLFLYTPEMANDQDISTAWVEGRPDAGIDEWIKFNFDEKQEIYGVSIMPGYGGSEDVYFKNNRVKQLRIEFSNDPPESFTLADEYRTHDLYFDPVKTDYVRIVILDVYLGSKYNDTAISEVDFY